MPVRTQFLALLPPAVQPQTLRQRDVRGETALAYRRDDPLAIVALRVTEALAPRISIKIAAGLTDRFLPLWSDAVAFAESDPDGEQCYLVVADMGGGDYRATIGPLTGDPDKSAIKRLPANAQRLIAVSMHKLIADLRADAERAGVALPARLVPKFPSPEYVAWRETIETPQQAAITRAGVEAPEALAQLAAAKRLRREIEALRRQGVDVAPLLASFEQTIGTPEQVTESEGFGWKKR